MEGERVHAGLVVGLALDVVQVAGGRAGVILVAAVVVGAPAAEALPEVGDELDAVDPGAAAALDLGDVVAAVGGDGRVVGALVRVAVPGAPDDAVPGEGRVEEK